MVFHKEGNIAGAKHVIERHIGKASVEGAVSKRAVIQETS